VTPTVGVSAMLFGLVACIVGGLGSLVGAVLGGFLLGVAAVTLQVTLPLELRPYRDAFLFGGVFLVILVRPEGLVRTTALQERV
jgi:branched-chain amino acid transport system permease protein